MFSINETAPEDKYRQAWDPCDLGTQQDHARSPERFDGVDVLVRNLDSGQLVNASTTDGSHSPYHPSTDRSKPTASEDGMLPTPRMGPPHVDRGVSNARENYREFDKRREEIETLGRKMSDQDRANCMLAAQQGQFLIKYPSSKRLIGGSAPPEERFFRLVGVDEGKSRVIWGKKPGSMDESKAVYLKDVTTIELGHFSKAFERVPVSERHSPWLCLSLNCPQRTLDIAATDLDIVKEWLHGLRYALKLQLEFTSKEMDAAQQQSFRPAQDEALLHRLQSEQIARSKLEHDLNAMQEKLAHQPSPIVVRQTANPMQDDTLHQKLNANTQDEMREQLASESKARSKLEQELNDLKSQLAGHIGTQDTRLQSELATEREARGQLQQQLEQLNERLDSGTREPNNDDTIWVTLHRTAGNQKFGLRLHLSDDDPAATVSVAAIAPGGLAAASGKIFIGDQVLSANRATAWDDMMSAIETSDKLELKLVRNQGSSIADLNQMPAADFTDAQEQDNFQATAISRQDREEAKRQELAQKLTARARSEHKNSSGSHVQNSVNPKLSTSRSQIERALTARALQQEARRMESLLPSASLGGRELDDIYHAAGKLASGQPEQQAMEQLEQPLSQHDHEHQYSSRLPSHDQQWQQQQMPMQQQQMQMQMMMQQQQLQQQQMQQQQLMQQQLMQQQHQTHQPYFSQDISGPSEEQPTTARVTSTKNRTESQEVFTKMRIFMDKKGEGYEKIVKFVRDGRVNMKTRDENGNTLLHVACQKNNKRVVKLLLRSFADINSQNDNGNTPLHYCYQYKHIDLGDYLISKGADVKKKNSYGLEPSKGLNPAKAEGAEFAMSLHSKSKGWAELDSRLLAAKTQQAQAPQSSVGWFQQARPVHSSWQEAFDQAGRLYYYNWDTCQSQWDAPAEGFWDQQGAQYYLYNHAAGEWQQQELSQFQAGPGTSGGQPGFFQNTTQAPGQPPSHQYSEPMQNFIQQPTVSNPSIPGRRGRRASIDSDLSSILEEEPQETRPHSGKLEGSDVSNPLYEGPPTSAIEATNPLFNLENAVSPSEPGPSEDLSYYAPESGSVEHDARAARSESKSMRAGASISLPGGSSDADENSEEEQLGVGPSSVSSVPKLDFGALNQKKSVHKPRGDPREMATAIEEEGQTAPKDNNQVEEKGSEALQAVANAEHMQAEEQRSHQAEMERIALKEKEEAREKAKEQEMRAALQKQAEDRERARKQAEEEEVLRLNALEEEKLQKQAEEEEQIRLHAVEQARAKKQAEEEQKQAELKAAEDAKKMEALKKQAEDERIRQEEMRAALRKQSEEEEAARKRADEEKRAEEEKRAALKQQAEEASKAALKRQEALNKDESSPSQSKRSPPPPPPPKLLPAVGKGGPAKGKGAKGKGKGPPTRGAPGSAMPIAPKGPKGNTKPLFWNTLSTDAIQENTVWGQLNSEGLAEESLDLDDVEKAFSKKTAPTTEGAKSESDGSQTARKKREKVTLVDPTRSRNIEIMLSSIKIPHEELVQHLMVYDKDNVLTLSQVLTLAKYIPSSAEKEKLEAYKGDVTLLGKAETFLLQLSKVPNLEETLEVISVCHQFDPDSDLVAKNVSIMMEAAQEIQTSTRLTKVLEYILALGNHLNKGTSRAMAGGFKLEGLIKFTETKGVDQNTTLLHYLVSTISTKNPDLLELTNDLKNVKLAAKMSIAAIHASVKELENGLSKIQQAMESAPAGGTLANYFELSTRKFAKLNQDLSGESGMDAQVKQVLAYFGEQNLKAEEPFRIIDQFIDLFKVAISDVAKAKKRREDKEARRSAKSSKSGSAASGLKKPSSSRKQSVSPRLSTKHDPK